MTVVETPAAGPWRAAALQLARNRPALAAAVLLLAIVLACLAAPLYAQHVSHTDPFRSNINGEVVIDGQARAVIEASTEGLGLGQTPIGPTWRAQYLLGADNQGRDVAARLLYGGRASLLIAGTATLLGIALGALLGLVAGYFGGVVDGVLSRLFDVLWAFPVYLLAISLSIVTVGTGLQLGPLLIEASNPMLPALIIAGVGVPYIARPVRAQAKALRGSEFVQAAIGFGVPTARILRVDVLPNVSGTLLVFVPMMMALNLVTESALSFLSIGVQPPQASWGSIIQDGLSLLYTRPVVALAPGVAIVLTVLTLNVLGDALREVLDPQHRMKLR